MTRLVVFDLDGTIVDSAAQIVAAMRAGFAAAGRAELAPEVVLSIVGISLPQAVERLVPGIAAEERDVIVAAYRVAHLADPVPPTLYPAAAETLALLAARPGLRLAVASGKTRRGIARVLDQHGLGRLFHSLHGADAHPSKPDPAMLHATLADAGATADEAVMVGDSIFDMQMARAAGVAGIGVSWGYYPPVALRAAGAGAILAGFAELPALLDREGVPA